MRGDCASGTVGAALNNLLVEKDEAARMVIAHRVGECLSIDDLPEADRCAAQALATELACDAIERVRCELSKAVRHAKFLPRDLALKISHDVDSVACPFLEVTEVFSESDWQQLILTISRSALVAVARRSMMPQSLALSLAELGNSLVAETLIENPASPMTKPVCHSLIDRYSSETWILDALAQRDDLIIEIAVKLTEKVSSAAREKLSRTYNMPDYTEVIGVEAEAAAMLKLIKETPESRLLALVNSLKQENKLTPSLLLTTLRENKLAFFETALATLAAVKLEKARSDILHAGANSVVRLLHQAHIPSEMHDDLWIALEVARSQREN